MTLRSVKGLSSPEARGRAAMRPAPCGAWGSQGQRGPRHQQCLSRSFVFPVSK